jgi:hypothetical protein
MRQATFENWDFFGTVAGVGIGLIGLTGSMSRSDVEKATESIRQALTTWDSQGFDALQDFMAFVRKTVEGGVDTDTAVGSWVLWNVKSEKPSADELEVAPIIGAFFRGAIAGSWDAA